MSTRGMPLNIAGVTVQVTHETVGIDQVQLNPDNPRIRFQIKHGLGGKKPSADELLDLVRAQPEYDLLQKDIRKAGGLHDPVIVRHDGLVVEGNSRVAAVKTLHAGAKNDARWKRIPVARLPRSVTEAMIAQLMAAYHVAGKTVWRPYAQADQIYQLKHVYHISIPQIADQTRMSPREVEQYLEAYLYLVKEVLPHVQDGKSTGILETKWSHALEFVKNKKLETIRNDPEKRAEVAKLIVENKIKGADVRELHKVFRNKKAATALKKTGFKAARDVLKETDPVAASKSLQAMQAYAKSLGKMNHKDIALFKTSDEARQVLIDLHEAVLNVAVVAGVKLKAKHV